jgi:hypothetical protein
MLDRKFDKVRFSPGTRIELTPPVLGSVGFDGVVLSTSPIPLDAELIVTKQSDNSHVMTIAVESDGFFLTEQLVAGDYFLTTNNIENPPPVYHLSIDPNQDWVGNIEMISPSVIKQ